MMASLSRLLPRTRRRFAAFAGLLALVVQLAVPVLHERDDWIVTGVHHSGGSSPELHVADWQANPDAHHDAGRCSQCRVVSQARTLAAPRLVLGQLAVRSQWLEWPSVLEVAPERGFDQAAPRGPPLSA